MHQGIPEKEDDGQEEAEQLHLIHKVRFLGNCQKVQEQTVPMAT
mgnify:CR=1 FL=1